MGPLVYSSSNLKLIGGRKVGWREVGRRHRVAVDGHHKAKHGFRDIKRQLIMQITVKPRVASNPTPTSNFLQYSRLILGTTFIMLCTVFK